MSNENKTIENGRYPSRKQMRKNNKKLRLRVVLKRTISGMLAVSMVGIGFGTSFAYPHKTIQVTVGDETKTVSTWADKVEDVLVEKNITVKDQDKLIPNKETKINTGDKILINEAKQVSINVDGKNKDVWTTSLSTDEIVDEFSGKNTNVTISARSPFADGTNTELVSKKSKVKVLHDGKSEYVEALPNEDTDTILKKIGVVASPIDKVTLGKEKNETVLTVKRVERGYETKKESIKFETKIEKDPQLPAGEQKTTQEGKDGEKEISAYFEKIDGKLVHQGSVTEVVKSEPTEEVIKLGVKGIDASKLPDDPEKLRDLLKTGALDIPNVNTNYTGEDPRALALPLVLAKGWGDGEYRCLIALWEKESHWNPNAYNASSGATGIPQALPGNKMASAGADWRTNPVTQIRWGLGYISGRYGSPCGAWGHSQARGWY